MKSLVITKAYVMKTTTDYHPSVLISLILREPWKNWRCHKDISVISLGCCKRCCCRFKMLKSFFLENWALCQFFWVYTEPANIYVYAKDDDVDSKSIKISSFHLVLEWYRDAENSVERQQGVRRSWERTSSPVQSIYYNSGKNTSSTCLSLLLQRGK